MPSATALASPRRRLLLLTADYPPRPWSGIGRAVEAQARALARRGHEVHVLVAGPTAPRRSAGERATATGEPIVHRLTRQRFPVDAASFDLAHLHSLSLGPLALELRRRFRLPVAYTVHGLVHHELPPGPRARRAAALQQHLLKMSDAVIFLSQAERRAGCAFVPAVAERCRVIPNGMLTDAIRADEPTNRERRKGPIVFAGRFAHSKGIDRFARLAPRLLTRHRGGVVLAGGHGDAAGQTVAAELARRFPSACRCPGWLDRRALHRLFDDAALVVVPSRYEPFGLVALEAMARGAPVLAADVGGLREVVASSSGSRRLAESAPDVWLREALEMLDDPQAGRRGPDFVRRRFSIAGVAERLEREVYAVGR